MFIFQYLLRQKCGLRENLQKDQHVKKYLINLKLTLLFISLFSPPFYYSTHPFFWSSIHPSILAPGTQVIPFSLHIPLGPPWPVCSPRRPSWLWPWDHLRSCAPSAWDAPPPASVLQAPLQCLSLEKPSLKQSVCVVMWPHYHPL